MCDNDMAKAVEEAAWFGSSHLRALENLPSSVPSQNDVALNALPLPLELDLDDGRQPFAIVLSV